MREADERDAYHVHPPPSVLSCLCALASPFVAVKKREATGRIAAISATALLARCRDARKNKEEIKMAAMRSMVACLSPD
jgi:hypothetical protein